MAQVLILFAHPALEKSRVHQRFIKNLAGVSGITLHDLYEQYPDFDIDVKKEQQLLLQHDIIIWQHPFYWYSAPAMIKQWQDLVLEHGWAYGRGGKMLMGKYILNVVSCGGSIEAYAEGGLNRFTIRQLLAPFEQTAFLCHMVYLPPFVVHGTHRLSLQQIDDYANQYISFLKMLTNENGNIESWQQLTYLNEWQNVSS